MNLKAHQGDPGRSPIGVDRPRLWHAGASSSFVGSPEGLDARGASPWNQIWHKIYL